MVIQHHGLECHVKRLVCYIQGQGHSGVWMGWGKVAGQGDERSICSLSLTGILNCVGPAFQRRALGRKGAGKVASCHAVSRSRQQMTKRCWKRLRTSPSAHLVSPWKTASLHPTMRSVCVSGFWGWGMEGRG